jgi:hypothetical protein
MPYIVLMIFFILQSLLLITAARTNDLVDSLDMQNRDASIKIFATAIQNYYNETGNYPASTSALAASSGYEYLKNIARPFQSLTTTNGLNDTVFQYKRAAIFIQDPYDHPLDDATYLSAANNTCGTGSFATAIDWCGTKTSRWWKHETRTDIQKNIARERKRLRRLLDKFNAWYNFDISTSTTNGVWGNNYPNPGVAAAQLNALVTGFAQTATTCTGIYTWHGIPFDCSDLYSVWGTPTVYNFVSNTHITLLTRTPYTKTDGTTLFVSTEESL